MFISFEGPEGSGKSTQLQLLAEFLRAQGKQVLCLREPGGTELGEQVRELLLQKRQQPMSDLAELLLFCASRAQLVEEKIRPALAAGQWVLVDRFIDSTAVYQGLARGLGLPATSLASELSVGDCLPQLTLLFDVPLEVSLQRMQQRGESPDRIESESRQFHQAVREGYLEIARQNPARIRVLQADCSREVLSQEVQQLVKAIAQGEGG